MVGPEEPIPATMERIIGARVRARPRAIVRDVVALPAASLPIFMVRPHNATADPMAYAMGRASILGIVQEDVVVQAFRIHSRQWEANSVIPWATRARALREDGKFGRYSVIIGPITAALI